ncbi:hypothetical protein [Photobacterium indicum]|jgi:plasmid maintenance system antidote protein VapI|uniref:Transcriptional regulator n=1 Tax=Photobacterium indicum TaxID=81447 RepID=A0A2T3LAI9_9GAMM|nr:hypothetical protein [Photobacterium indicum]PSV48350.1 hypothetical protein C9J47_07440 [Photobacterium indicum]
MSEFNKWPVFWREFSIQDRDEIAKKLNVSAFHLRNIGKMGAQPSASLAVRIEKVCGYPKEMLRPDIFGEYKS